MLLCFIDDDLKTEGLALLNPTEYPEKKGGGYYPFIEYNGRPAKKFPLIAGWDQRILYAMYGNVLKSTVDEAAATDLTLTKSLQLELKYAVQSVHDIAFYATTYERKVNDNFRAVASVSGLDMYTCPQKRHLLCFLRVRAILSALR